MDTQYYGNKELMAEADRDIEELISGQDIKPNKNANNAYKQKLVDYLKDHEEDIDMPTFTRISGYIRSLDEIIMSNEARSFAQEEIQAMNQPPIEELPPEAPAEGLNNNGTEYAEV
jgi:hypothetical protein